MALGYLLGKRSSKGLRVNLNIPLLLVLSILPDIDIIYKVLTGIDIHRGATHSIIVAATAFIPIFIIYRKRVIPYFLALISHPLIGDFFIGGRVQLFWPISTREFGLHELGSYYFTIFSPVNIALEITLFVIATLILYKSGDWKVFFSSNPSNLLLIIPVATVLLPSTIGYPFSSSLLITEPTLALAHIIYLLLFSIAITKTLTAIFRRKSLVKSKTDEPMGSIEKSG